MGGPRLEAPAQARASPDPSCHWAAIWPPLLMAKPHGQCGPGAQGPGHIAQRRPPFPQARQQLPGEVVVLPPAAIAPLAR